MTERLMNLDRRIIFLFVFLGVTIPLLTDFRFPIKATSNVRAIHSEIERVAAENGTVLVSFDYGPGSEPELQPMALSLLRHCFSRNVKVVAMCLWPDAPGLAQEALDTASEEFGKTYGVDYAFLGYKPGTFSVIINMGQNFRSAFARDARGNPTDSLAVTREILTLRDFSFVFDIAAGASIDGWWIPFGQEKYKFSLGAGCTAVMAPDLFPFLQSKQLAGLVGGLAGAAEYETLIGRAGTATDGMRPQSVTHLIIIAFIVLGNAMYFLQRRASRRAAAEGRDAT
ncbi:MAG: hypothetical protein QGI83_16300 [Candidatus Latescibacteria bacterium]|jgi:hypothetical protein|nr:hypothetical protein [Candidatus Latescibacterota bacterium]